MGSVRMSSLGFVAAIIVLGGSTRLAAEEPSKPKRLCVNRREINVIKALDDRHALAKLSANRHYLFTLDKTCQEFHLARQVAISDGAGRVCGDGLTLVSFEVPTVGPMRCRIEGIDAVPDEAAARELIASRRPPE
jgi:hypothetical protein